MVILPGAHYLCSCRNTEAWLAAGEHKGLFKSPRFTLSLTMDQGTSSLFWFLSLTLSLVFFFFFFSFSFTNCSKCKLIKLYLTANVCFDSRFWCVSFKMFQKAKETKLFSDHSKMVGLVYKAADNCFHSETNIMVTVSNCLSINYIWVTLLLNCKVCYRSNKHESLHGQTCLVI